VTLDDLPDGALAPAEALLGRLKHDLGKYVSLQARWLGPDAGRQQRMDALTADLLRTRRGPDGEEGAHAVWAPFHEVLTGRADLTAGVRVDLGDDPDVRRIVAAMNALGPVVEPLADGSLSDEAVGAALDQCTEVAYACRDLVRRIRPLLAAAQG